MPLEEKQTIAHSVGRHGELRLGFDKFAGRNRMKESYFRTPLQVMRAIPDSADCLVVYMLSPTGGIVQSDRYKVHIRLEAGSHALLTTIAANKVYKMPSDYAEQIIEIEVHEGAILEYVPDALILFEDADLRQNIHVRLATGALCILQDTVMAGRLARNEFLQFKRFKNQIRVEDDCGLLLFDSIDLQPNPSDLTKLGLYDSFPCWANWYLLGDLAHWGIDAEAFCQANHDISSPHGIGSISRLYRNGISARFLSKRLEFIDQSCEHLRKQFRHAIQIPYTALRK